MAKLVGKLIASINGGYLGWRENASTLRDLGSNCVRKRERLGIADDLRMPGIVWCWLMEDFEAVASQFMNS
jgi:hypothetical protein